MSQVQPQQHVSPLRQRMIEDMHMRKLSPKTQSAYIRGGFNGLPAVLQAQ